MSQNDHIGESNKMITPDTLITAELLAGLDKCPFCGDKQIYIKFNVWSSYECLTSLHVDQKAFRCRSVVCEHQELTTLRARVKDLEEDCKQLQGVAQKADEEICQTLGKALGYPWFKDDPKNFPECTEADGVCVGDHCGATLALEMVDRVKELEEELECNGRVLHSMQTERDNALALLGVYKMKNDELKGTR